MSKNSKICPNCGRKMNMPNKLLLDRALYKKIKAMDRETMDNFIQNVYQTGKDDVHAAEIDFDKRVC